MCRVLSHDNTTNLDALCMYDVIDVCIIGVVRVQHPTVGMRHEFNYGGGFGRVLSHDNTTNLAIIIALITRGKYGVGLFMGGG